ncbi:unnamed protein product [Rotaria socialis]|uniref:DDE-1 domain-containing protein n=1 Tax=Rotaria socialis TaxID=392032 RepID=A0A818GCW3_9BILA|nr:unnamed protein product [Rotaria socialis]
MLMILSVRELADNYKISKSSAANILRRSEELLADYSSNCNRDETGLFYRATPDRALALSKEECKGGNKSKERLAILLCLNLTGTEKLKPVLIGKSQRPRCFKNITMSKLPVTWLSNRTAWMTCNLFTDWLIAINNQMRKKNRKMLLFIDNAPCHVINHDLSNIKIVFFPRNATSKCQPLDQGVIHSFKCYYRQKLVKHISAQCTQAQTADQISITVLDANKWIDLSWKNVTENTITNGFRAAVHLRIGGSQLTAVEFVGIDSCIPTFNEWNDSEHLKTYIQVTQDDNEEEEEEEALLEQPPNLSEAPEMMRKLHIFSSIEQPQLHNLISDLESHLTDIYLDSKAPTDAYQFFTSGQQKLQKGLLREGFELISEAHKLLNKVYGPMHPEICMCLRLLARLNYIMGNYQEALITQRKAVMMAERVLGIDHPQPATEYIHIALYSFANGLSMNASKLLCRARYIILTCCGENHPQISLIDSNLGLILLSYGDYENALNFYGTRSLKVALSHHLCARIQSYRGDFRSALNSEREAYQIYKLQLGDEHERTRESAQILKHLTEQAVVLQKRINNAVNGQLLVIPSLTIQQPSFQSVLEMLNVVNELAKQSTDDQKLSTPSTTTISEVADQAAALLSNEID